MKLLRFKFHQNRTINKKIDFFEGGTANSEGGRGVISKKKNRKPTNFHPKMNIFMKFHLNQKMVKFRGKIFWGGVSQWGGILKKK